MNAEKEFIKNIDHDGEIDKMHRMASKILNEYATDPEKFKGCCRNEQIEQAKNYVIRFETKFKEEESSGQSEKLSQILEGIILEHGELSEWFGPDARTIKTSRYDDIKHGIDLVVEFGEEDEDDSRRLGLAVDVTFCANIDKKIGKIKEEIGRGELGKIEFFKPEKFKTELPRLPKAIIAVECRTVKELGKLWFENKNKDLAVHPVQMQILEEILLQIESFREYAETHGQEKIAAAYENLFDVVDGIYQDKIAIAGERAEARDQAFHDLKKCLDSM